MYDIEGIIEGKHVCEVERKKVGFFFSYSACQPHPTDSELQK